MNVDIYFPLFENILHGDLNPLLSGNVDGYHYTARLEQMIVVAEKDTGMYGIRFEQPFNLKTRYYHRRILADTLLYIADIRDLLQEEGNSKIRAFLRNQLLDKHLTTCLMRLGEKIQKECASIDLLHTAPNDAPVERVTNTYIFQFLKVCIAKAYLEFQHELADVVAVKQTETMLYASLVGERYPVKQFLHLRKNAKPKETDTPANTTESTASTVNEFYTSLEVMKVLLCSESTLLRLKKRADFPKPQQRGNKNVYLKSEIDIWKLNNR
ncbi:MAG: hypothetical protein KA206_00655 [Paludibacter sp.]|nr:hypothetical protein [Paludibacter sp.]